MVPIGVMASETSGSATERRFVTCVSEDSGGRVKRWAFDVPAIAVASGVSEARVRNDISTGKLDPGVLRSVCCYVAAWELGKGARS